MYEGKHFGKFLSTERKKRGYYEFCSLQKLQYNDRGAQNDNLLMERSFGRNFMIRVTFFSGAPTAGSEKRIS